MKRQVRRIAALMVTVMALGTTAVCYGKTPGNAEVSSANFVNSYHNTDELAKKYPVINPTPIDTDMGKKIENRLLSGFENWNRGYEAWKAWGDILYTKDSIYNVHGVRMTLPEYQTSMNATLKQINIQMGNFNNMIICDDWAAIFYDISTTVKGQTTPGNVMEFVHFKDYGTGLGVRVEEGWGGPKDNSFDSMSMFQTEEEKKSQQDALNQVLAYQIPDSDQLEEKYPIKNPTTDHSDNAAEMKRAILQDFDSWNKGYDTWAEEAGSFYTSDAVLTSDGEIRTLEEYKTSVKEMNQKADIRKLYFDNMLISGDWAAIHYRYTNTDTVTGETTAGDAMQFYHFVRDCSGLKVDKSWIK